MSSERYTVTVWGPDGDPAESPWSSHDDFKAARTAGRAVWRKLGGSRRVIVCDEKLHITLLTIDPGPLEVRDSLPCHDPEHVPTPHRRHKEKK